MNEIEKKQNELARLEANFRIAEIESQLADIKKRHRDLGVGVKRSSRLFGALGFLIASLAVAAVAMIFVAVIVLTWRAIR